MSKKSTASSPARNWETCAVHDWEDDTELVVRLAEVLDELSPSDMPILEEHVDVESLSNGLQAVAGRQFTEVHFSTDTHEIRIHQDGLIESRRQSRLK